ncbi:MAG: C-GCAxxG-C-C family protein [Bacillota bacterium]
MNLDQVTASVYRAVSGAAKTREEAELFARLAAGEAAQAANGQTLDAANANGKAEAPDSALFEAIHEVRGTGELPYWLCKAAACLFVKEDLSNGELRDAIRERGSFLREPDTVQLIFKQCLAIREKGLMESMPRVEILKRAYRDGYRYEKECRGCAQCTIAAMFDVTGKKEEHLFRAANGFAAGMGLFGDGVCGGYSGGLLYMGTYAGRRFEFFDNDKAEKDLSMRLAEKLHTRFIETYGSVICHDIHRDIFGRAFFIRDSEEKDAFEEAGAHRKDKCPAVVGTAAQWTAEILMEEGFLSEEDSSSSETAGKGE